MAAIIPAVCLLLGLLAGLALAYLMLNARQAQALAQSKEAVEARLRGELGAQIAELKVRLDERERELANFRQEASREQDERISELTRLHQEHIEQLGEQFSLRMEAARADAQLRVENEERLKKEAVEAEKELSAQSLKQAEKALAELREGIGKSQQAFSDHFNSLASKALESNSESFLKLAKSQMEVFQQGAQGDLQQRQQAVAELIRPITEKLGSFDAAVREIELKREGAYAKLAEQIRSLSETEAGLHEQADNLSRALRGSPTRWGRWGEMQLRNVIELAGMQEHCDFVEQQSLQGEGLQRPDVTIRLPGGQSIAIDSKAPLEAYLKFTEAEDDEQRAAAMAQHSRNIRKHIADLASKDYWKRFESSPEFVVMFIPGESFFSAAVNNDPGLIDFGVDHRVVPASPTTLIALLKAVAYGWKQEQLERNAAEISKLGRELYDSLRVLSEHMSTVGKHLNGASEAFNKAVSNIENRTLVRARRFKELGAEGKGEIPILDTVNLNARHIAAPELKQPLDETTGALL